MSRNLFLFLFALIFSGLPVFAQPEFVNGYIIKANGDSVAAKISSGFTRAITSKPFFIQDAEGKSQSQSLDELVAVGALPGPRLKKIPLTLPGKSSAEPIWVRVLAEGSVNVYEADFLGNAVFYAAKSSEPLVLLNDLDTEATGQYGATISGDNSPAIQVRMRNAFGGCDATFSLLTEGLTLARENLIALANAYEKGCGKGQRAFAETPMDGFTLLKIRVLPEVLLGGHIWDAGNLSGTIGYGGQVRLTAPTVLNKVFLDLYYSILPGYQVVADPVDADVQGVEYQIVDSSVTTSNGFGFRAGYRLDVSPKIQAYAALGAGFFSFRSTGAEIDEFPRPGQSPARFFRPYETLETKAGIQGAAGINYLITPNLHLQVESGYRTAFYVSAGVGYEFVIKK